MPVEGLLALIGERLRLERLRQEYTQETLADKAGVSARALRNLEAGRGAQLTTFVQVMKALGAEPALQSLLPEADISPMALIERSAPRQRGRR
jgi:transcriptional regulator with XRE-family HTH domain